MVDCPECGKPCDDGFSLAMHWSAIGHEGDVPDHIDTSMSESHRQKISEANTDNPNHPMKDPEVIERRNENWELTDEGRKNIAEANRRRAKSGKEHHLYGYEHTEEAKRKISENNHNRGRFGEDHPAHGSRGQRLQEVEETRHVVSSNWEREIDLMLHEAGVDYEYEPEAFDLGDRTYTPDFIVGDVVIEVKGYEWRGDRAEAFMEQYPEYTYVIVGNDSVPADLNLTWDEKELLVTLF